MLCCTRPATAATASTPALHPAKTIVKSTGATETIAVDVGAATTPRACCCGIAPRPQDQIWLVSCRGLSCDASQLEELKYWYYAEGLGWTPSDADAFHAAADPSLRTAIWVHGNRIESGQAFGIGIDVYRALIRQAPSEQPLRFVAWSWPSERVEGGPIQDARVKAARTTPAGHRLARFIVQMDAAAPVSVIGYSFGCRIITGALHLMGGGVSDGDPLAAPSVHRAQGVRAVLIAPAIESHWLLPGRTHGLAMTQVESMFIIVNSCDKVLKHYHLLYCNARRRNGPQALGTTGLVGGSQLGEDRRKIEQTDACCLVGPEHYWRNYFQTRSLVARMVRYVFDE